jgi:hypothetical protein
MLSRGRREKDQHNLGVVQEGFQLLILATAGLGFRFLVAFNGGFRFME